MSLLSQLSVKRLLPPFVRLVSVKPDQTLNSYGDSSMPDKLYKTIELELKSSEPAVLKSYEYFVTTAANHLGVTVGDVWSQPKATRERWYAVLKSIHIYRKHLVQYEIRSYFTWIRLHKMTGSTADTLIEYIERMLPEGVALKVTKISIEPKPAHLTQDAVNTEENTTPKELQ